MLDDCFLSQTRVEGYHGLNNLPSQLGEKPLRNQSKVIWRQCLDIYLCKSVHERLWQAFPSTALIEGILRGKNPKGWMSNERTSKFWNIDGSAMISDSIEAFQNSLGGKVHLIQ